jgi:RNA polymerase sigma-70 factor, ECF subfamily
MADFEIPDALRDETRAAWHRTLDWVAPFRPALHGYCRRLTGDLWDAEDLVQDTLLRAFAVLGHVHQPIRNPRAYLLRTATHLWIDRVRRQRTERRILAERADQDPGPAPGGGALREAGEALLRRLSPQERAAVVLKDVFEMSLEETAEVLETSVGAVKAALSRGRGRLGADEEASASRPTPPVELVDRFVELYRAADLPGLVALMLESGSIENVGVGVEFGTGSFESPGGWFHHALHGHPEWPPEFRYERARVERALLRGEPVVLGFTTRRGREALEQVLRFEERDGRILRIRGYAFCPETMREVAAELGLFVRTGLYRYPTPEPGTSYARPA